MASDKTAENRELIKEYPFLAVEKGNDEYSWYDDIPEGWKKAFGLQMVKELKDLLLLASKRDGVDWLREYEITDVKEKYGSLRWSALEPSCIIDEYEEWEEKYENLSYETCIECGAPADGHTMGWIIPLCSQCAKKHGWELAPGKTLGLSPKKTGSEL